MSITNNDGVALPKIGGQTVSDLICFAVVLAALDALRSSGHDATGYLSFDGASLTVDGTLFADSAVVAAIDAVFGTGFAAQMTQFEISMTLVGGHLTLGADGQIETLDGTVQFLFINDSHGHQSSTQFFDPSDLDLLTALAGTVPPADPFRTDRIMQDVLTQNPTISYGYTGSAVSERMVLGSGSNSVFLFGGNDVVVVTDPTSSGNVLGGIGADTFDARLLPHRVVADLQAGTVAVNTGPPGILISSFENVVGSNFQDRLFGSIGNNVIRGNSGNDRVFGQDGDDHLFGDDGNDSIFGGNGQDVLIGGNGDDSTTGAAGDDKLLGGAGNDTQYGGDGADTLDGGPGNDTQYGGAGNDSILGGPGNDQQFGGDGNDSMYGGRGRDHMTGGAGNDVMEGGEGKDTLFGGDGDDTLDGGEKGDFMEGGAGADQFRFHGNRAQGDDTVGDFSHAQGDKIALTGVTAGQVGSSYDSGTGVTTITYPDGSGGTNTIFVHGDQVGSGDFLFLP